MKQHKWTEEKLAVLTQLFPIESTKHTAAILQMSMTAVKRKAKEMGLQKETKSCLAERAEYVRCHFQHSSLSEMAKKLNISRTTVMRIIEKLGFKRTKEQTFQVRSRIRAEIIRRERRHVLFGLAPVTRIKVVTNRTRIQIRAQLEVHRLYRRPGFQHAVLHQAIGTEKQSGEPGHPTRASLPAFPE